MQWTQIALDFVSSIAWPLVALVIVVIFRSELKQLSGRAEELSGPMGLSAKLQRAENRIEERQAEASAIFVPSSSKADNSHESGNSKTSDTADHFSAVERGIMDLFTSSPKDAYYRLRFEILDALREANSVTRFLPEGIYSISTAANYFLKQDEPLAKRLGTFLQNVDNDFEENQSLERTSFASTLYSSYVSRLLHAPLTVHNWALGVTDTTGATPFSNFSEWAKVYKHRRESDSDESKDYGAPSAPST